VRRFAERSRRFVRVLVMVSCVVGLVVPGLGVPVAAFAQAGDGSVTVEVRELSSGRPLSARIALTGPLTTGEISDDAGAVTFTSIPGGTYTVVVAKTGYKTTRSEAFDVRAGGSVVVRVALPRSTEPQRIGAVRVRTAPVQPESFLDVSGAVGRSSRDFGDALSKTAGVSLVDDDTPGAGPTISLEGRAPAQTAATLDGIPLNAPGVAADLRQIDPDLFRRATISFRPSAAGSGGTVNFQTIDPTPRWLTSGRAESSSYGRSAFAVSEQGTFDRVGVAVEHVKRSAPSLVSGERYLDASGLDYTHDGFDESSGDLVKLRYAGAVHNLSTLWLRSDRRSDAVCLQYANPLPCGFGPGNSVEKHFNVFSVGDVFALGSGTYGVSLYRIASATDVDLAQRFVARAAAPFSQSSATSASGVVANASVPLGANQSLAVQLSRRWGSTSIGVQSGGVGAAFVQPSSFQSVSVSDTVRMSPRVTLVAQAGSLYSDAVRGAGASGGLSGVWQPNAHDAFALSADVAHTPTASGRYGVLSDPASLAFDCTAHTATGFMPGDDAAKNAVSSYRLLWQRAFARGRFSLQAYAQTEKNASLTSLVSAQAFGARTLPVSYFAAAGALYASPSVCGAGAALPASGLYFATQVSGVNLLYRGARAAWSIDVNPRVTASVSVERTSATVRSNDFRLVAPLTLTRPDEQLRGVAPWRGNVLVSYDAHRPFGFQAVANVQYVSAGNGANLPAYALVDLAVAHRVGGGSLSLTVNNAFDTYGGTFASHANALPLVTVNGTELAGIARPNAPRAISVAYSAAVGPGAVKRAPTLLDTGADGTRIGPPGYLLRSFAKAAPLDPFERNTGSACTRDQARLDDRIVAAVQTFAGAMDRAKTRTGFPAQPPVALPAIDGVDVSYYRTEASYAILLSTGRLDVAQALVNCTSVHIGSPADARAHGVYTPTDVSLVAQRVFFSPEAGFYLVQMPTAGIAQRFRTFALPATRPQRPFRLQSAEVCKEDLRPIATSLLAQLETYFAAPNPASGTTTDWTIVKHDGANAYYELRSNQIGALTSLVNCGYVAGAARADLSARGFDGAAPPAFNYAPEFGLYVVSGAPPAGK
jgi:hypothetical protein